MSEADGSVQKPSLSRRVTCDFLRAGMAVPTVSVQLAMNVAEVAAARENARPRPTWCAVFTKAYGKVVARRADLRQAYLTFPWERIYQYPHASADVVVESLIDDEPSLVSVPVKEPDRLSLLEIDRLIAWYRDDPIRRLRRYRKAREVAKYPRLFRNAVWWTMLNVSGFRRSRFLGAFGVTTVGKWGVESLRPISPWMTLLHYGMIDPDGNTTVRLTYDHRVLDGAGPSMGLVELERVLKTEIVEELRAMPTPNLHATLEAWTKQ